MNSIAIIIVLKSGIKNCMIILINTAVGQFETVFYTVYKPSAQFINPSKTTYEVVEAHDFISSSS